MHKRMDEYISLQELKAVLERLAALCDEATALVEAEYEQARREYQNFIDQVSQQ